MLPVNEAPYTTMVYVDPTDGRRLRSRIVAELAHVAFESSPPIRTFPVYRGRRSHQGRYWFSRTGQAVPFESRFEMTALISLDFRGDARRVSSNPFWLLWPPGLPHKRHAPDFFIRRLDGSVLVIDVKPEALLTDADRALHTRTRAICRELSWDYEEFTTIDRNVERNLRILHSYSHSRFALSPATGAVLIATVRATDTTGMCLADLLDATSGRSAEPAENVLCGIYHMLWRHDLHVDLHRPLTWNTRVHP